MRILAGDGGAAIASHATNILLNTTRMEALGLAAGMSYARKWKGKVRWYIDNKGVIENFWKIPHCVANDWSKIGDRDVFGYIDKMRDSVQGEWDVRHQEGHVEGRKKDKRTWTDEETGNVNADHVAGRVRLQAVREESVWLEQVDRWNRKVSKLEKEHTIIPERLAKEVKLKTRVFGIPKVELWLLPNKVRWELCWDNQVVVGKVAAWVRETIQNTISNNYLASQTAGLFRPGGAQCEECESVCEPGDFFELDGETWEVINVDEDEVRYGLAGESSEEEDWKTGTIEEISSLVSSERDDHVEDDIVDYSPDPDVRLIRNVWTKGNLEERVRNVKFMWGIYACNELLFKRFGMGESVKCGLCGEVETPWHVIGVCPGENAVSIRTIWADRMWKLVQAETTSSKAPLSLDVANALKRMWNVDDGGTLRTWQPGTSDGIHDNQNIDTHLKELIDNVTSAGSWAVWMGVFSRGWMEMLVTGGMPYHRARRLTSKISGVIMECRSEIAKERNERAAKVRVEEAKAERAELVKVVQEMWDQDRRSITEGGKRPACSILP